MREVSDTKRGQFESKVIKINLEKTKIIVSGSEGELTYRTIDPFYACGRRVMANSKWVTPTSHIKWSTKGPS